MQGNTETTDAEQQLNAHLSSRTSPDINDFRDENEGDHVSPGINNAFSDVQKHFGRNTISAFNIWSETHVKAIFVVETDGFDLSPNKINSHDTRLGEIHGHGDELEVTVHLEIDG